MIDSTRKMRAICEDEPLWEELLQSKGLPFKATNPITALVAFDDMVKLQKLDKEAFLVEFEACKAVLRAPLPHLTSTVHSMQRSPSVCARSCTTCDAFPVMFREMKGRAHGFEERSAG